jgi:adenylate cyclase
MIRPDRYQVTILLVVILLVSALSVVPRVLLIDETLGLYWLFQVRGTIQPADDVAVISIDGESANAFGLSSVLAEWPRDLHARLIEGLNRSGAAVVVFDIIFDRARDPDRDRRFAQAIAEAGNVILLERVRTRSVRMPGVTVGEAELEHRELPLESLRRGALATAPFVLPVVPMRVGQFWTFGRGPGDSATLPAVALAAYLPVAHERLVEEVRPHVAESAMALPTDLAPLIGNLQEQMAALRAAFRADPELGRQLRLQADPADEQVLLDLYTGPDSRYLNYYGPPRTVPTWTYHEVLRRLDEGGVFEVLRGRVVFVGFSESHQPEQQDSFHSVFTDSRGLHLSGVEIAATALLNLLHRQEVRPLSVHGQWLATLLFGLVLVPSV